MQLLHAKQKLYHTLAAAGVDVALAHLEGEAVRVTALAGSVWKLSVARVRCMLQHSVFVKLKSSECSLLTAVEDVQAAVAGVLDSFGLQYAPTSSTDSEVAESVRAAASASRTAMQICVGAVLRSVESAASVEMSGDAAAGALAAAGASAAGGAASSHPRRRENVKAELWRVLRAGRLSVCIVMRTRWRVSVERLSGLFTAWRYVTTCSCEMTSIAASANSPSLT